MSTVARLAAAAVALAACRRAAEDRSSGQAAARANQVPRIAVPITIDGRLREPAWNALAVRGVLRGPDGTQARPYSELRLLHDAHTLYVGLYAADQDIRTTDGWRLVLGRRAIRISALGRPSAPDVRAAVTRDGTLDHPSDDDEEWVIEAAVPLATLGPPPLAISARRCDTPKDGHVRCGQWHGKLGLQ